MNSKEVQPSNISTLYFSVKSRNHEITTAVAASMPNINNLTPRRRYVYSIMLYLFGLLLIGYGIAYVYSAVHSWCLTRSELSWATTDATVESWTIDIGNGARATTTWSPEWRYTYKVAGHLYSTQSHAVADGFEASRGTKEDAVRDATARPIGSSVRVYYDPANPQRSVLDRRNFSGWAVIRSFFLSLSVLLCAIAVLSDGTLMRKIGFPNK
ncbi:DUF3592 domain-containing protein [Burkholderia sp. 3C]